MYEALGVKFLKALLPDAFSNCCLRLLSDQRWIFLSSPDETKIVSAARVRLFAKDNPLTKLEWALIVNNDFLMGMFQKITSPSAEPEIISAKLYLFLAITYTPSEWSLSASKNGLAKSFSNLAAFSAL